MAIAAAITYTFLDDSGDSATTDIHIPNNFALSQYVEFGRAMAALIDAVVHGLVSSVDLTIDIDLSTLTGNAVTPFADVEEIAAFQFVTADGRHVMVNVPGTGESTVSPNSDDLNLADVDVAAFVTAMENGIAVPGGTASPCDVNGDDIIDLVFAREQFRASGKRR